MEATGPSLGYLVGIACCGVLIVAVIGLLVFLVVRLIARRT